MYFYHRKNKVKIATINREREVISKYSVPQAGELGELGVKPSYPAGSYKRQALCGTIKVKAIYEYNELPSSLRQTESFIIFKQKLKQFSLEN